MSISIKPALPKPQKAEGTEARQAPSPTILSMPAALFASAGVMLLSYWGASARWLLVPHPGIAALVTGICFFLLMLPFVLTARTLWVLLSPEVMGGLGYLIYMGVGAFTNHTWPGLAVNPSLFRFLPAAIAVQTIGALAFFGGARAARNLGLQAKNRRTCSERLALVMFLYALFVLYVTFALPRADPLEFRRMVLAGESVSWLLSVGPEIVFHSLPMLIAAWSYLRGERLALIRISLVLVFGFSVVIYLVSGSRRHAAQLVLLLFVAYTIVVGRVKKSTALAVASIALLALIGSTWLRLSGGLVVVNPGMFRAEDLDVRAEAMISGIDSAGVQGMLRNVHENLVYHLSDNQAMAMVIMAWDRGPLLGKGAFSSLLSALPRSLRPSWYQNATGLIASHYRFYKEQPVDAPYWPDWQLSIGLLGFADFGPFGLILYPLLAGIFFRWVYNRTVLTRGLGEAGWLVYIPLLFVMWNPHMYGPDTTQILRLLIPMALALRWTAQDEPPTKQ